VVRALADNAAAMRFYHAMGGRIAARDALTIGGARLDRAAFVWD
jgi:hypothetical protein